MSWLKRFVPDDTAERQADIARSRQRLEDTATDPRGLQLVNVAEWLRSRNVTNHYAEGLREAYGSGDST